MTVPVQLDVVGQEVEGPRVPAGLQMLPLQLCAVVCVESLDVLKNIKILSEHFKILPLFNTRNVSRVLESSLRYY